MNPWPIHTLVFDLDDTLFAERDYVASGFRAAGVRARALCGITDFAELAMQRFQAGQRTRVFDDVLAQRGVTPAPQLVGQLVAEYRGHTPAIGLLPAARSVLDWARGSFRLALVSDGYLVAQQRKVAALGLERWIPLIVLTDGWGREFWKPSPRGFDEVMRTYPGEPAGYVYVSDNPKKDFIAPRVLGWRTVRVRRAGGECFGRDAAPHEAAEREIAELDALPDLLEPVEARSQADR